MGISGFFYYLKNSYKKSFSNNSKKKYDYLVLDYHSLFHNIKSLYDEINYAIRLLFEAKYQYENNVDDFYMYNIKSDNYNNLIYIINTYNNVFKLIGIDSNSVKFYSGDIKNTLIKINIILDKFPISEEIIKQAMIADIVEHTEILAKKYTTSNEKTIIYFDGIPSVAKIKEQLNRRIELSISKMINTNILLTSWSSDPNVGFEKAIRKKLVSNFPAIDLNSPLINETREILKSKGFTVNNKERYGEAEHQMMKDLKEAKYKNTSILIASPDADLILLSMIVCVLNNVKIDIYRESILSPSNFEFKWEYMKTLHHGKPPTIQSPYGRDITFISVSTLKTEMTLDTNQKIVDIVYLLLLLGDDFIPIISTFNVTALDTIKKLYFTSKLIIINMDAPYTLNTSNLIEFLKLLAKEEATLKAVKIKKFNFKIKDKIKNTNDSYNKYLVLMNSPDNIVIKKIYYLDNGIVINDNETLELLVTKFQEPPKVNDTIIKNYMEGYRFIFDLYYLNNIANYKWCYNYNNAPTLNEIVTYLDKKTPIELTDVFDCTNGIITATDLNYFNFDTYKQYIDDNKNKMYEDIILKIMKGKGEELKSDILSNVDKYLNKYFTYANVKYIYKCVNALYIKSCINYDEELIDPNIDKYNTKVPADMLGGDNIYYMKYLKYKSKYINLSNGHN